MKLLSLIVILLIVPAWCGSKYSAEKNAKIEDFTAEMRPFRMQKVNLLWQKAKKRLTGSKLAELYADLKVHDKHEAALKKYRVEGMDKDGLKEAHVNAAFREIIEKYELEEFYHSDGNLSNELPLNEEKKAYFSDQKLQSMWKRAEKAGFTGRDLEKLREEFWHQQMKIDELSFLKRQMEVEDVTDNEVESSKKKNQRMKSKHKAVKAGYYELESMFDELEREDPDFKDHRVHQLWAMAQKTGWTAEELQSFKEELLHFENRLQKHEYLESQVERSAESMREGMGGESQLEKHNQLERKAHDVAFKVKKLHNDLKTRVGKAFTDHSEL
ncbi:alpha-2-macroglobulin receptor-associated protein-like [Babylonia areolata]|uniref:alpha-2-macroglobulin receptor-associated protein-like n=1 Tax=Babylonia areolata TaxID=304850 RepID=UPI003FD6BA09